MRRWLTTTSAPIDLATLELVIRAAGNDSPGAEQLGDLQRGDGHTSANTPDQNRLAGLQARARVTSMRHAVRVASEKAAA